ncbi:uncharacterized protein LOC118643557 [Molossus molossus]|uniref:uncharacterized protein LOC118643557 n=1 Tax=Molossus molossus TaxID=27622 RepID=UPI0017469B54|nr:uncharacterized protein LOC118643557 [Molossus molossus]
MGVGATLLNPARPQEQCITFDRVLSSDAAQEAEQELLARVQPTLGSVGRGYSVALLLWGRATKAPGLVPQLLQMLFEEVLLLGSSDPVLSTLSLVQLSPRGRTQDLLSPGTENLSVLDVAPLGLVVEDAREVEVPDSRAASELYLRATGGEARDCPLLQVLAGKAADEEVEGSLSWIISWLLEGNNYTGLLLRLDPQGSSLNLLQAALLGAAGRRMQEKQVKPTLWDAAEESRARRAGLKSLRSGLLGDPLTDGGLSQLGRALRELKVVKAWRRYPGSCMLKGVTAEAVGLPEPQAQQTPDMALQFFLAQAQRQRLREQHQSWIQEELKHLKQQEKEEEAGDQVKGLVAGKEASMRQRWHWEQTVLRLQLEALQSERDTAEQDLRALYDLHVQTTRARTCHVLQVFQAWRGLWEEQTMATEHHHRSLLAGILQDTINLAAQNQELQTQNQELQTQNQELQIQNQELQTQNQELQTQNQELQIQNQELQTQNQQLWQVAD